LGQKSQAKGSTLVKKPWKNNQRGGIFGGGEVDIKSLQEMGKLFKGHKNNAKMDQEGSAERAGSGVGQKEPRLNLGGRGQNG